ncbi:hypothetical protein C8R47DRAFT_1135757 [Mycena vitilis]|nr:hypothetical protein C8R47DRAFT_1135757 [Mycena vitilis]
MLNRSKMHESLRPEQLSGLPTFQRALATIAIDGSVSGVRDLVGCAKLAPEETRFLPVFYHHLNPDKIPSDAVMDTEILRDNTLSTITRAFLSLEGISYTPSLPLGSRPALWTRVWSWIQFFDVHHSRIADAPPLDVCRARFFCVIASLMEARSETSQQIISTPGVMILAAQAWGSFFRYPNDTTHAAIRNVAEFNVKIHDSKYDFADFVEGAGGVDELAVMVVQLVPCLVDSTNTPNRTALNLCALVIFAGKCDEEKWTSALVAHKYLSALTSVLSFAARFLEVPTPTDMCIYSKLFRHAWNVYFRFLLLSRGYSQVVEIIDADVLTLVVSLVNKRIDWVINHEHSILSLITLIVRPATLYYPVLSLLEVHLPRLEEATSTETFRSSRLHRDWQNFVELALERLEVKRRFDSGGYGFRDLRACDNMECGRILRKSDLKRCAGCGWQHYCSKQCQIKDWHADHKRDCQYIRPPDGWRVDHLDGPLFFASRDRAFLRAMVAHDYERHKEHIFITRMIKIGDHGQSLYTMFNYGIGPLSIQVYPPKEVGTHFIRALHSNRRMHLVFVKLPKNGDFYMLQTRASNSAVHDALCVPEGSDVSTIPPNIVQSVRSLIDEVCPVVMEIIQ